MSIVGPRPHALKMDDEYQKKIALYARRHNVKPGITGWAQINGLRGITDSAEKMEARVEHDLFYIENWSLWFDVYIMAMTLVSPSAYRNAG
jgi:lipopolysaccharide/colanic/teichoic acid biosynthesis glycosyltransferase